jgi:hypothetical protein
MKKQNKKKTVTFSDLTPEQETRFWDSVHKQRKVRRVAITAGLLWSIAVGVATYNKNVNSFNYINNLKQHPIIQKEAELRKNISDRLNYDSSRVDSILDKLNDDTLKVINDYKKIKSSEKSKQIKSEYIKASNKVVGSVLKSLPYVFVPILLGAGYLRRRWNKSTDDIINYN